mmetsp:Transcript_28608/g.28359  ORF Transcript_28608/g.28359 Transcript_28608/m.28359 type:complete len:81 (+) Transcript_28608:138-380(+)
MKGKKYQKLALKPIKIPEDSVETPQESSPLKDQKRNKKIKDRNESVDACTRNKILTKKKKINISQEEGEEDGEIIISSRA